jgi:TonB family protein
VLRATKQDETVTAEPAERVPAPTANRAKISVLLVTRDDLLWPQIGPHLSAELILKQLDTVDELVTAVPSGQPAIILWDARQQADAAAVLSRLQLHSSRFAVVALDDAANTPGWAKPVQLRQIVAQVSLPLLAEQFTAALANAREEVNARMALLGAEGESVPSAPPTRGIPPWLPAAIAAGVLIACAGAFFIVRRTDTPKPVPAPAIEHAPQASSAPAAGADDKVDTLIEKAQQAMLDRHFFDPADGSALTLYKGALLADPNNGEAQQGLQRLAEILFARVQSALDERKFDVALQSLEAARNINPADARLAALDARITSLRAELGPAQIQAAINALNFDRAAQLIDEATRTKSLNAAKISQLRDDLRRRHEEFDTANFVKLIDTRLQQDRLIEPRNDSAAYYLGQARAAGVSAAVLQPLSQEISKRLAQTVRTAIDQEHFADADRLLGDLHTYGVPAATIASLQHDLAAARSQQAAPAPVQPKYLDLAQSRLAQGSVTEPANDSALFYVNQLRAADPKNAGLARISAAVQAQILGQARAALDAAQPAKADALLQTAAGLGASADLDALTERLLQVKLATAALPEIPQVAESSLTRIKTITLDYPTAARRKSIEGWVELSYLVTTEGKVAQVKLLDSSPAGVFDVAATQAVSRVLYKPTLQNGKPTAVSTKLRIAFRLAN